MQRQNMEPIYEADREWYDKHKLYQFLGISKNASKELIRSQLERERRVKDDFVNQQMKETKDLEAKHEQNLKDLYMNFEKIRILLTSDRLRSNYDLCGDRPGCPPLPARTINYYQSFAPPPFDPPRYLIDKHSQREEGAQYHESSQQHPAHSPHPPSNAFRRQRRQPRPEVLR